MHREHGEKKLTAATATGTGEASVLDTVARTKMNAAATENFMVIGRGGGGSQRRAESAGRAGLRGETHKAPICFIHRGHNYDMVRGVQLGCSISRGGGCTLGRAWTTV